VLRVARGYAQQHRPRPRLSSGGAAAGCAQGTTINNATTVQNVPKVSATGVCKSGWPPVIFVMCSGCHSSKTL
jgi:hypothetical protein